MKFCNPLTKPKAQSARRKSIRGRGAKEAAVATAPERIKKKLKGRF